MWKSFQYLPRQRECVLENIMQSLCFTPVWAGPRGPPHSPPSGLMTPPAGWDPPSVTDIKTSVTWFTEGHQLSVMLLGVCCVCLKGWNKQTSSKNCCVRRRMCLSSVSSRKFFFRASWLVLISFSSFSSFSKVACQSQSTDTHCYGFIPAETTFTSAFTMFWHLQ